MALKITEENFVFVVEGPINAITTESFQNQLNIIMDNYKKVTINIDKVNEIDANGLSILREFYLNGLRYNRDYSIVGYSCKAIYDQFKFNRLK